MSVLCKGCGKELKAIQVDQWLGNPKYNRWAREGYCSLQCFQQNADHDLEPPSASEPGSPGDASHAPTDSNAPLGSTPDSDDMKNAGGTYKKGTNIRNEFDCQIINRPLNIGESIADLEPASRSLKSSFRDAKIRMDDLQIVISCMGKPILVLPRQLVQSYSLKEMDRSDLLRLQFLGGCLQGAIFGGVAVGVGLASSIGWDKMQHDGGVGFQVVLVSSLISAILGGLIIGGVKYLKYSNSTDDSFELSFRCEGNHQFTVVIRSSMRHSVVQVLTSLGLSAAEK